MTANASESTAPGKAIPYVLRAGEGAAMVVAGQVVRTLAGVEETAGGYGVVTLDSAYDRQPIPLHFHEKEHDTWLCTRGRLQVWANGTCRTLTEGDFAYVKPGDVHSYQCVSPRTQFFGVVAPGGWEGFFHAAGQPWSSPSLPPPDYRYDFSRMGPAMGRFGVMRVDGSYAEPSNGDASDRVLPEGPASYVLQSGYGERRVLNGHLATTLLSTAVSSGALDMRTIEAGQGARMPVLSHTGTHVTLYVLDGTLRLALDGVAYLLSSGDFANVPTGTSYDTEVISGAARWVLTGANGNGLDYWSAGIASQPNGFDDMRDLAGCVATLAAMSHLDLVVGDSQ